MQGGRLPTSQWAIKIFEDYRNKKWGGVGGQGGNRYVLQKPGIVASYYPH